MPTVNVHQAKTHLSQLLEAVERGEEVIIARAGKPVARLMAIEAPRRQPGSMRGKFHVGDAFFEPLPEEWLATMEGGHSRDPLRSKKASGYRRSKAATVRKRGESK